VVLEMMKKGFRADPGIVAQLKAHQWAGDAQKKDLIEKFQAMSNLDVEDIAWTAADPTPELRTAGLLMLKRRGVDRAVLDAVVALARTRSEAVRKGVQRFLRELAGGGELGGFLAQLAERGDDFAKLTALEMAQDLPPERAFAIYRRALSGGAPLLRSRALRAICESKAIATSPAARSIALAALKDEDEETRVQALAILEQAPDEELVTHLLALARSGGAPRVAEAAFASLERLLPTAKGDHTREILSLLADGNAPVRKGALALVARIPADILAPRFLQAFEGTFVWIRDRALETVVQGNPGFVPALLKLASSPDPAISSAARELSLLIDDPRAVPSGWGCSTTPTGGSAPRPSRTSGGTGPGTRSSTASSGSSGTRRRDWRPPEPWGSSATRGRPGLFSSSSRLRRTGRTTSSRSSTRSPTSSRSSRRWARFSAESRRSSTSTATSARRRDGSSEN
jgi:HEAT repeat protein